MTTELNTFDELAANITVFVAPTKSVQVSDIDSSAKATEVRRQLKFYSQEVEKKRQEMVRPLNERVNEINARCKAICAPILEADSSILHKLNSFASEQEAIKQAEMKRIAEERQKAERAEMAARVKAEEELKAKQAAEAEIEEAGASLFGDDEEEIETESVTERNERERLELDAKFQLDRNLAETARKQAEYDAGKMQVKGARKTACCEPVDFSKIPKEYLIVTLNSKMVIAAYKGGIKEIPGVRIWEEISVSR